MLDFIMTTIIPIASGKGGVGKTVFAANLGVSLARHGKTVILIDLDLGGSNLHTCLGVRNRHPGIGYVIYNKGRSLESLVVSTDIPQLHFIPGDTLFPGTANLPFFKKKKILQEIRKLVADYILIDLGGGSSFNTIDFFLVSNTGLIVTNPQTTAVLNAYAFIKSSIFRLLYRSFPPRSEERNFMKAHMANRLEGSDLTLTDILEQLKHLSPEAEEVIRENLSSFHPRVVMNMGKSQNDLALGAKLRHIVRKNLEIEIEYIGFVGYDDAVDRSIVERTPLCAGYPESNFASSIDLIREKLMESLNFGEQRLFDDDEDIKDLMGDADEFSL